jgi:hypothetical protein
MTDAPLLPKCSFCGTEPTDDICVVCNPVGAAICEDCVEIAAAAITAMRAARRRPTDLSNLKCEGSA